MATDRSDGVDLDHAVEVLGRHGWEGARALAQGDEAARQGLWLAALQHDRDVGSTRAARLLHDRDVAPLERVRDLVHRAARDAVRGEDGLVAVAACERGVDDPATAELVDDHLAALSGELVGVLELAMEQGRLRRDVDPRDLAETLVVLVLGLHVAGRVDGADRRVGAVVREVDRQLDAALAPG